MGSEQERRDRAWEVESAEEFLDRVQALVTEEYLAAEDASEPFISIGIIHQLDDRRE